MYSLQWRLGSADGEKGVVKKGSEGRSRRPSPHSGNAWCGVRSTKPGDVPGFELAVATQNSVSISLVTFALAVMGGDKKR